MRNAEPINMLLNKNELLAPLVHRMVEERAKTEERITPAHTVGWFEKTHIHLRILAPLPIRVENHNPAPGMQ